MIVPVVHSLTGQVLQIELADGALVEELRNCLKVRTPARRIIPGDPRIAHDSRPTMVS